MGDTTWVKLKRIYFKEKLTFLDIWLTNPELIPTQDELEAITNFKRLENQKGL